MKSAIQNDVALGIFYQLTRCHRIGHGNTLCKLKETRVFGGFWRTAFFGLKKRWIILIYLIITEIKVIFVMEGRGSYRAREARQPASLAGYNKIWCAVPPSCRGAAAPLFLCPDSSAAFHAALARGLMLNHYAATVGLTGDGTAYPSEASKKRMATDWPNAGCCHRSFLIYCSV